MEAEYNRVHTPNACQTERELNWKQRERMEKTEVGLFVIQKRATKSKLYN